jgi:hypothetical protein
MTASAATACTASSRSERPWSDSTTAGCAGRQARVPRKQRRNLQDRDDKIPRADDHPLGPRGEPAGRERQQQVGRERRKQRIERDAGGEHRVVVRVAQPVAEPGEAGGRHQRPRAVPRPPPPREQPRPDERPPHQQPDRHHKATIVDTVAVENDRGIDEPERKAGRRQRRQRATRRGQWNGRPGAACHHEHSRARPNRSAYRAAAPSGLLSPS